MSGTTNRRRSKVIKSPPLSKTVEETKFIYRGVESAQRLIQQIRTPRHTDERTVVFAPENLDPPVRYYQWQAEYSQTFSREKLKRSMTKDCLSPRLPAAVHAKEHMTSEEECCSRLVPATAVQTEKPTIRVSTKASRSNTVRFLRKKELMPSERTSLKQSSVSPTQLESSSPIRVFCTEQISEIVSSSETANLLLNRTKLHLAASVIRRPPRRLIRSVTYETIAPIAVYA